MSSLWVDFFFKIGHLMLGIAMKQSQAALGVHNCTAVRSQLKIGDEDGSACCRGPLVGLSRSIFEDYC